MKFVVCLLVFLSGIVTGAGALGAYWRFSHAETEVWKAGEAMKTSEGIMIPSGTELILRRWMKEGYAQLEIAINVEGAMLDKFERSAQAKSFLRISYWLEDESQ